MRLQIESYRNYFHRVMSSLLGSPKYFYQFVNFKRRMPIHLISIFLNGFEISSDIENSNVFAEFFRQNFSIAVSDVTSNYPNQMTSSISITYLVISDNDVLLCLRSLKYSCASGPDCIPSCSKHLCAVISKIFNLSLKAGVFSLCWKSSSLIPFT